MASIAQLLHVSDFHFVGNLTQEGREWYARLADLLRPKPHSFKRLEALTAKILLLEQQGGERKPFDLMLVTGDLTTNGAEEAFRTAWHYITSESIYMGSPGRLITNGLNAQHGRRLLVPGNHDRFARDWIPTQEPGNLFESILVDRCRRLIPRRDGGLLANRTQPSLGKGIFRLHLTTRYTKQLSVFRWVSAFRCGEFARRACTAVFCL